LKFAITKPLRVGVRSEMPRVASKTSNNARRKRAGDAEPSLPYEDWLLEQLKDPEEAAGYLEAVIEEGNQSALLLALRQIAMANGGIAAVARRAKLTREAAYRMLSRSGNPELRSLNAILGAAGLRLSVKPIGPVKAAQKGARYSVSKRG
jgi:probable addiction module antidote protein